MGDSAAGFSGARSGPFGAASQRDGLFGEMLSEHGPRVHAIARRITGSDADAQDVAQEVFLAFHSALAKDMVREDPGAWLGAVAANAAFACAQRAKSRRHRPITDEMTETLADSSPLSQADRETYSSMTPIIETLPEKQRQAFVLRTFEGLSYRKIGKLLGCQPRTAMKHFELARRQVRLRAGPQLMP